MYETRESAAAKWQLRFYDIQVAQKQLWNTSQLCDFHFFTALSTKFMIQW